MIPLAEAQAAKTGPSGARPSTMDPSHSFYDREAHEVRRREEPSDRLLSMAYGTVVGRALLKVMAGRWPSSLWGHLMASPLSRRRIRGFCSKNGITDESLVADGFAPIDRYGSFAAFFLRPRPVECAGAPGVLYSPVDGFLTLYRIKEGLSVDVKGTSYTLPELLGANGEGAGRQGWQEAFRDGHCLAFRLSLTDYHHFHYPAAGRRESFYEIAGELHSVRRVASGRRPFSRNRRSVSLLELDGFGPAAMIEVGAMLVGRIEQDEPEATGTFAAGAHKGHFALGGSTVILIMGAGVTMDADIEQASRQGLETKVRAGTCIGGVA